MHTSNNSPNIRITSVPSATEESCLVLSECMVEKFVLVKKVRDGFSSKWHSNWVLKWWWDKNQGSRKGICKTPEVKKSWLFKGQKGPKCERAWCKMRVVIPHHSLLDIDADCFLNISSLYINSGLHYSDYMPGQYVHGPELTNRGLLVSHSTKINWALLCARFWARS